jgi:predicted transposase YbfD/YdcC
LVSAWATENRLVFAQVKVDESRLWRASNEITAIPELLSLIALKGAIVTIDAMGCQYAIANKITGMVVSYRTIDEKTTGEVRYFLSSLPADAELFATAVRALTSYGRLGVLKTLCTMSWTWRFGKTPAGLKTAMPRRTWPLSGK